MTGARNLAVAAALVALGAVNAAAQQAAAAPSARRERPQPQGFSVVLVLADVQGTPAQDDVPPAARRALTDMKDFLPYKSYKLLDAAWILGQGNSSTRLKGADERDYELRLHSSTNEAGVNVRFVLDDADDDSLPAAVPVSERRRLELAAREQELARLSAQLETLRRDRREKEAEAVEVKIAELRAASARRVSTKGHSRAIMDTTFSMQIGETVVVGTSRLRGGSKALIALLTSVPPRSTAPPR